LFWTEFLGWIKSNVIFIGRISHLLVYIYDSLPSPLVFIAGQLQRLFFTSSSKQSFHQSTTIYYLSSDNFEFCVEQHFTWLVWWQIPSFEKKNFLILDLESNWDITFDHGLNLLIRSSEMIHRVVQQNNKHVKPMM
jgi:hypothetical protein